VLFERPAITGNPEDMKNTTAAAIATGGPQRARGSVGRGVELVSIVVALWYA
jgi:hypothetical protein